MKSKATNFLILPTLTLSCGLFVTILLPNRGKVAVLIGSTAGSIIGSYFITRQEEKQSYLTPKNFQLSPQERLIFLQKQVTLVQSHLHYLSQDINGNYSVLSPSSYLSQQQSANSSDNQEVLSWLTKQGIIIQNYHKPGENEEIFNKLALYIGEKYAYLSYFYAQLKRSFSKDQKLVVNLASRSKEEITCTTQFCSRMSAYAFLSSYQYDKKNKMLYASPQRTGLVINFITGGWFEKFVYLSLCQLISNHQQSYKCVLNPQIVLQDGRDFELDILFLIDEKPFWVECKTGDYQAHVRKYSGMRSVLSIPKECSLLVILGISNQLTQELTSLHDIYVANENNFLTIAQSLILNH